VIEYFHSVRLDQNKCKGCTNCIKGCPTEAIRVRDGKAHILEERCIDCGECIRNCPEHAKYAITDPFYKIKDFKISVAIPAPSFFGQFSKYSDLEIVTTLKIIGFYDVYEVALGADYVSMAYRKFFENKDKIVKPSISSACPAVVRLIQVKFPSLIPNIIPIESPMAITAYLAKKEISQRYDLTFKDIGVFFISPCPAKVTATKQPVAGSAHVDGVISMSDMYRLVHRNIHKVKDYPDLLNNTELKGSSFGLRWARPGGESIGFSDEITHVQVQGISHVSEVLEQIEMGKLTEVDFLEMQACTGGCLGGPLVTENPFVARVFLNKRAKDRSQDNSILEESFQEVVDAGELYFGEEIKSREIMKLDENIESAMIKMQQIDKLTEELPGLDCGACGAPTCRALAEDIVQGHASRTDCTIELRHNVQNIAEELLVLSKHLPPTMEDRRKDESGIE